MQCGFIISRLTIVYHFYHKGNCQPRLLVIILRLVYALSALSEATVLSPGSDCPVSG